MQTKDAALEQSLEDVIGHIRPEVRRERAYLVGQPDGITTKLNQNESPFDLPEELKVEIAEAVREIPFNRYPTEHPYRLRDALSGQLGHPPEGILLGNGSNELVQTLGLTLIDPGTPVVLPTPMFSLYAKVVRLHGGRLISVGPREDLSFDAEALVEAIEREQPGLVVITTPNNPTGLAMGDEEVRAIIEAAPGMVVVDEAYAEFVEGPGAVALIDEHPGVLVMRTFSKAAGLAGLRLGYLVGHPEVVGEILKARLPFMIDRVAEETALTLMRHPEVMEENLQRLKASTHTLTDALVAMDKVEVVPSDANFVIFKTPLEPAVLSNRLAKDGVLVRNVSGYPELAGFLRVNAGTEKENNAFLTALNRSLT